MIANMPSIHNVPFLFFHVAVLWRCLAVFLDDPGVLASIGREAGLLDTDLVPPLVAEVEDVEEPLARPELQPIQPHPRGALAEPSRFRPNVLGRPVPRLAAQEEGVQVVIVPAERILDCIVEIFQRLVAPNLDRAPDVLLVCQGDSESVDRRGRRRWILAGD